MSHLEDFRPVAHVRPAAPYFDGKRNLAAMLCQLIEATPHRVYAEPFVGMGGVFLGRRHAAPSEVVNDISRDVVTFFRVVQRLSHTAATSLMKAGVDERFVQRLLGHRSIVATLLYTKVSNAAPRSAVADVAARDRRVRPVQEARRTAADGTVVLRRVPVLLWDRFSTRRKPYGAVGGRGGRTSHGKLR